MIYANWQDTGSYNIQLRQTNQYGCDTSVIKPVEVIGTPKAEITGTKTSCVNNTGTYELNSPDDIDSIGWEVVSGKIINQIDSHQIKVKWHYDDSGGIQFNQGEVHATVYSDAECNAAVYYPVELNTINAEISPEELNGCAPLDAVFSAHESENADAYLWKVEDEVKAGQRMSHTFEDPGFKRVRLVTKNDQNCWDTVYSDVNVTPKPEADFTITQPSDLSEYRLNDDKIVTQNQSEKADHFIWEFGDGFTSNEKSPEYEYSDTGDFEVTLYASKNNGCMDSMKKAVNVIAIPYLHIPSAFSPNGDGLNDVFAVKAVNIKDFNVKIFNRWGEKIFEASDQDFNWDGTYKGEKVPMESYLYKVTAKGYQGEFLSRSGTVTVVR